MTRGRRKGDTCAPLSERFWRRVKKTRKCWLWTGAKNKGGYGHINSGGKYLQVKRVAYELAKGPILAGLEIDHLCRNPRCVRPDHLEAVTHKVNVLRGMSPAIILHRQGRCSRGHEASDQNVQRYKEGPRKGRVAYCVVCRRQARQNSSSR